MRTEDFSKLRYFGEDEVRRTGANPADVTLEIMLLMDRLRFVLGRAIILLRGGITTGSHSSPLHPAGRAVDFTLRPEQGEVDPRDVIVAAYSNGFTAAGAYHNGRAYSFHVDNRAVPVPPWIGYKKYGARTWRYAQMLRDPADVSSV